MFVPHARLDLQIKPLVAIYSSYDYYCIQEIFGRTNRELYLKPSYFSGTLILAILARGLVIAKFNTR